MKKVKTKITIISTIATGLMVATFLSPTLKSPAEIPKDQSAPVSQQASQKEGNTPHQPEKTPLHTGELAQIAPKQAAVKAATNTEHIYRALLSANDPFAAGSWALQKTNATSAWDTSTGSTDTTVAVIDTGFALNHEDLSASWKTNSGEIGTTNSSDTCWTGSPQNKQTNSCDDDENGYEDDWRGWNFSAGSNNPQTGQTNTNGTAVSHGTSVAGLVGAVGNNSKGIATLSWNTKVMPLQALSDTGVGYTSDVAAAVYYAVDNGADVINMSLGGDEFDPVLDDAIQYAYQHNVVVVAAAGNCGTGNENGCDPSAPGQIAYPAVEKHVISVGASNQSDQRASFSSYGDGLDVMAPGFGTIISPVWTSGNQTTAYSTSLSGTSFAAPQTSSLAALIKSVRPQTTVDDITALILGTSTKLTNMGTGYFTTEYGHGLINASKALTVASALNNTDSESLTLSQSGGAVGEQIFSGDSLGSSCLADIATYCTVWLTNTRTGFDRYLPYSQTNGSGEVGWNWTSGSLTRDAWEARVRQGEVVSDTPYFLLRK